jgi:hypothetical protein
VSDLSLTTENLLIFGFVAPPLLTAGQVINYNIINIKT